MGILEQIENENNEQIVSARLLHGYLEIKTKFNLEEK